ncbi:MAG: potassium channel protein [Deltaproteobacteria bacterium RBG_13_61_14]|nr:MAG: potassium channel protein [Deltaproteobacteria bacterium RBG_13_61_14]
MFKNRMVEIIEPSSGADRYARCFNLFIVTLILLNVLAVISETVKSIETEYSGILHIFEVFSVAVFTVEYLLRVWLATCDKRYQGKIIGRLKFLVSPLALIDLLAILPFYLPMVIPLDLRFIRTLRLARMSRIFKIGRYSGSLKSLANVLKDKKEEMLITIFAVVILLVIASSLMYYVENEIQPEAFSSIPAAMWWGVATLTTVGYGDIYPITPLGKLLGSLIAFLGIGLFALPAGVLSSGFIKEIQSKRQEINVCPHCGKEIVLKE